jgi:hypothetical protein
MLSTISVLSYVTSFCICGVRDLVIVDTVKVKTLNLLGFKLLLEDLSRNLKYVL